MDLIQLSVILDNLHQDYCVVKCVAHAEQNKDKLNCLQLYKRLGAYLTS